MFSQPPSIAEESWAFLSSSDWPRIHASWSKEWTPLVTSTPPPLWSASKYHSAKVPGGTVKATRSEASKIVPIEPDRTAVRTAWTPGLKRVDIPTASTAPFDFRLRSGAGS